MEEKKETNQTPDRKIRPPWASNAYSKAYGAKGEDDSGPPSGADSETWSLGSAWERWELRYGDGTNETGAADSQAPVPDSGDQPLSEPEPSISPVNLSHDDVQSHAEEAESECSTDDAAVEEATHLQNKFF